MVSQIKVDSVLESTSGNGVSVDGALIKDNFLAASAGGGLVKLAEYTFSSDADKDFDVCDGDTYFGYKLVLIWKVSFEFNSVFGNLIIISKGVVPPNLSSINFIPL